MNIHLLQNEHLRAGFSADNGRLVFLAASGSDIDLVANSCSRYFESNRYTTDNVADAGAGRFETIAVKADERAVESVVRSGLIEHRRRYALAPGSFLLQATSEVRALGGLIKIASVAMPRIEFAADFNDAFEDEEDLYFDGEELGGGMELPPWRVFFRAGRRDGVMIAARSKLDMSRLQIMERSVEIRPHAMVCYDSGVLNPPMAAARDEVFTTSFEIGPWDRSVHRRILEEARLNEPVKTASAALSGSPPPALKGTVFYPADFTCGAGPSSSFHPERWMLLDMPHCAGGRALVAGPSVHPPKLVLNPRLAGLYRIYIGIANGDGAVLRLSGDEEPTMRAVIGAERTPFHLRLSGPQAAREIFFKTARMDGRELEISRFPNSYATTIINYARFEKLTSAEADEYGRRLARPPVIGLSGFNDIPDISVLTDARDPDPGAYRNNLWEHANCGIRRVYWRIDGQCSDYPSKHNTMRYVSAKVHGIFSPQMKAYGRALKKTDMLALAVKAARDFKLELYGWMRFNSYAGNVVSDFFRTHPQFREESESGNPVNQLCLAFPEVRKHKIDILVEAAGYGLAGLNLGFLRHPPVLSYAPILVKGYEERYGRPPPRNRQNPNPNRLNTLPESDAEHERWFRYRAGFLTAFARELKAALKAKALGHVKISIWVRPEHCLLDGIDLPIWLEEGLCDEVVADNYSGRLCRVDPEWKRMVQSKALLVRGVNYLNPTRDRKLIEQILAEKYDGLCFYESDWCVVDTDFIRLFDSLRQ